VLPEKTASGDFFKDKKEYAYQIDAEALELLRENQPTPTKTASGRRVWLNRDPIEEEGGLNLHGIPGNDILNYYDALGLTLTNCTDVSFSVSVGAGATAPTPIPFLFVGISGDINISVTGQKCTECCSDGSQVDYFNIGAQVQGALTLTVTAGIVFNQNYGNFSVDVWGGIQGSASAQATGGGSWSNGCDGEVGSGSVSVAGSLGIQVGASASFSIGRWSLGQTGITGGGTGTISWPYDLDCGVGGCTVTPQTPTATAQLQIQACMLGLCFTHNF